MRLVKSLLIGSSVIALLASCGAVDIDVNAGKSKADLVRILKDAGASEVNEKNFD
jgi:hypothetical protein